MNTQPTRTVHRSRFLAALAAGALGLAVARAAPGVEPPVQAFPLWPGDELGAKSYIGLDVVPSASGGPGVELVAFREILTTGAPNGSNYVAGTMTLRVNVHAASGATLGELSRPIAVTSKPYPDPGNRGFQQPSTGSNPNATRYCGHSGCQSVSAGENAGSARARILEGWDLPIGAGIAQSQTTGAPVARTLVFGAGIDGEFHRGSAAQVPIGRFAVVSHDARTRVFLCQLVFDSVDAGGFELAAELSSVGNYLSDAAGVVNDEIRIVSRKELPTGKHRFQFRHYHPRTCALLSTVAVDSP